MTTHVHTAEQNFEPLCGVDTGMAISKLKKKRTTTGHDEILAELIKQGGKELKVIHELILKIWQEEILP